MHKFKIRNMLSDKRLTILASEKTAPLAQMSGENVKP